MTTEAGPSVKPLTADDVNAYRSLASMGHVGIGGKLLTQMLDEREELRRLLRDMRNGYTSRVHFLTCTCDVCERYRRLMP